MSVQSVRDPEDHAKRLLNLPFRMLYKGYNLQKKGTHETIDTNIIAISFHEFSSRTNLGIGVLLADLGRAL